MKAATFIGPRTLHDTLAIQASRMSKAELINALERTDRHNNVHSVFGYKDWSKDELMNRFIEDGVVWR